MPDRTRILLYATIIVLLFASPALGNAGSVAMLAGAAHLLVGNLVIGLAGVAIHFPVAAERALKE
jgi:hypothetical protein